MALQDPLVVSDTCVIPASDLTWEASRSSGPGGQNVNKVASKIELRFDLPGSRALSAEVKERLRALAKGRLDGDGKVLIISQLTRDQGRNLDDALDKLRVLIQRALVRPTPRRPTRPTRASKERRLTEKRQQSQRKQHRSGRADD